MTAPKIAAQIAADTINRVEHAMIEDMSDDQYREYMAIPEETRKHMLYMAYKMTKPA